MVGGLLAGGWTGVCDWVWGLGGALALTVAIKMSLGCGKGVGGMPVQHGCRESWEPCVATTHSLLQSGEGGTAHGGVKEGHGVLGSGHGGHCGCLGCERYGLGSILGGVQVKHPEGQVGCTLAMQHLEAATRGDVDIAGGEMGVHACIT